MTELFCEKNVTAGERVKPWFFITFNPLMHNVPKWSDTL